jgi:hypothetical protein
MLKKTFKTNTSLITNLFVSSEDNASDTDFVFQNILDIESLANINGVIDFESIEYKHVNDSVEFDIFFLQYLLKDEIDQMKNYVESSFNDYSDKVLSIKTSVKSELFEIRDDNDLRAPQFDGTLELTRNEIKDNKPYVVVDPFVEIRKNYPSKPGYPHFYNTFAFPFWEKKDAWVDLKYGFNNKTYTYNSFLMIEIYDTYEVEKQKKITTIPIYVSDRYLFKEKRETKTYNINDGLGNLVESVIEGITQKRPVFNLSEGIDGYSFFFLKKYIKSDFYVKFYFWDALNGKKIQFIPSGKSNNRKKWLQDVEVFNQKDLYLKYELDYTNKKYKIFDLNNTTGDFDIEVDKIDLYEFAYDDYWSKFFVANTQPTNVKPTQIVPVYTDILPFKNKITGKYSLTDTKYLTVKDGIRGEQEVIGVSIGTKFENVYGPIGTAVNDNYSTVYGYTRVEVPYVKGNYYGYFLTLANNIDTKTIGLLNIRDIKSGIVNIKGSKKRIESILLKNINKDNKGFLIESLSLENVKFTSNEQSVDLSNTSTLSYAVQNYPTGTDTYTETHVLPKINSKKTFSTLDTLFSEDFEQYKLKIENKGYKINQDVYDNLSQRIFANMSALGEQINLPINIPSPGDAYTPQNLTQKLVTEPLFKEQTFTLIASTISNKMLYDQEILISLDLVFGKLGLFYAGIIKEMNINGTLVINYIESDNTTATTQKLSIPINIDIK